MFVSTEAWTCLGIFFFGVVAISIAIAYTINANR